MDFSNSLFYPGDTISLWTVNVLLQITIISAIAIVITFLLRKKPVVKNGFLHLALFGILAIPGTVLIMQNSGLSLISLSVMDQSPTSQKFQHETDLISEKTGDQSVLNKIIQSSLSIEENITASGLNDDTVSLPNQTISSPETEPLSQNTDNTFAEISRPENSTADKNSKLLIPGLYVLWLAGTLYYLIRMVYHWKKLKQIIRNAQPISSSSIDSILKKVSQSIKTEKTPVIVSSPEINSPIATTLGQPHILLPDGILEELSPQQLEEIITHEMAHIKRNDQAYVILQNLAVAFYWFHPFISIMNRALTRSREEVCDNFVLKNSNPVSYSETLLEITQRTPIANPIHVTVGLTNSRWKLENRISDILNNKRNHNTLLTSKGKVTIFLSAFLILVLASSITVGLKAETNVDNKIAKFTSEKKLVPEKNEPSKPIIFGSNYARTLHRAIDMVADEKRLFVASGKIVDIFESKSLKRITRLKGHSDFIIKSLLSPRGTRLATVSLDHTIKIWDISQNSEKLLKSRPSPLKQMKIFRSKVSTSDAHESFILYDNSSVWKYDWSESEGEEILSKEIKLPVKGGYHHLTMSPDGTRLISNDITKPVVIHLKQHKKNEINTTSRSTYKGKSVLSLWKLTKEGVKLLDRIDLSEAESVMFSGNNSFVVSPHLMRLPEYQWTREFRIEKDIILKNNTDIKDISYHNFGHNININSEHHLCLSKKGKHDFQIWNTATIPWKLLNTIPYPDAGRTHSQTISPDGKSMFLNIDENIQKIHLKDNQWQKDEKIQHGKRLANFGEGQFLKDQKMIIAPGHKELSLWNWQIPSEPKRILHFHLEPTVQLHHFGLFQSHPFRNEIAIKLFNTENKVHVTTIQLLEYKKEKQSKTNPIVKSELSFTGSQNRAWSLAYTPDGNQLAIGFQNGTIDFYDITGQKPKIIRGSRLTVTGHVCDIDFSSDGTYCASGSFRGLIQLFKKSDNSLYDYHNAGHQGNIARLVRFSHSSEWLASCGEEGLVHLWSVPDLERIQFRFPEDPSLKEDSPGNSAGIHIVNAIQFTNDDRFLLTSDRIGRVGLWSVPDGKLVKRWDFGGQVNALFDPSEKYILAGLQDGTTELLETGLGSE